MKYQQESIRIWDWKWWGWTMGTCSYLHQRQCHWWRFPTSWQYLWTYLLTYQTCDLQTFHVHRMVAFLVLFPKRWPGFEWPRLAMAMITPRIVSGKGVFVKTLAALALYPEKTDKPMVIPNYGNNRFWLIPILMVTYQHMYMYIHINIYVYTYTQCVPTMVAQNSTCRNESLDKHRWPVGLLISQWPPAGRASKTQNWLVVEPPLWKIWVSWWVPIYGKNVPNHQNGEVGQSPCSMQSIYKLGPVYDS